IQTRPEEVISAWFRTPAQPDWRPTVLTNDRLDLAVARGAAYYGMVRRGEGVRIAAGLARSYYIEVGHGDDSHSTAVCVVPGRAQPGESIELNDLTLELRVSEPVEFPLYVSSTRLTDRPGQTVEIDVNTMRPLPPLRTALRTQRSKQRDTIPVKLHAHLSEIGTIELWCSQIDGDHTWRLQFDVRAATETDRVAGTSSGESEGTLDESAWQDCAAALQATFGPDATAPPGTLMARLSEALQLERSDWPMSLLRRIWEQLMELQAGRQISPAHEARWLNLLGYALRPGYGVAVDDWRVTETWRHVQGKLAHSTSVTRNESWILWRRISAGLPAGQQRALAEPLVAAVRALHRRMVQGTVKGETHFTIPEFAELWRLLGSLELLAQRDKAQLGTQLIELLPKKKLEGVRNAILWTLGRLGNRVPLYGPLNTVIDTKVISKWVEQLLSHSSTDNAYPFAMMQLARCTGDRHRDLPAELREQVAAKALHGHEHLQQLVTSGGALDTEEQQQAFGESLPKGLRISSTAVPSAGPATSAAVR
ncbi:MAG: molecular chaperone DnaK, partial [Planctomycetales bacterium]|nr:molecular chaperone DnaK [Planctomycetales bacterium]